MWRARQGDRSDLALAGGNHNRELKHNLNNRSFEIRIVVTSH